MDRSDVGSDVGSDVDEAPPTQRLTRVPPPPPPAPRPAVVEPAAGRPAPAPGPWRAAARVLGELLVTAGVVVLLFVGYELWVTNLFAARDQSALADQLHTTWAHASPAAPEVEPAVGQPVAVVRIPRLGADYQRVVVEGTDQTQLARGPGHYAGTAMPGQPGDFAVAGHRVGKGSPFLDLDTLRPGDAVVVETASRWYVYRVLGDPRSGSFTTDPSGIPGQEVVPPTALGVIAPVPDGSSAAGAYLTITTCNPKYSARTRLVVHARLDGAPISKAAAPQGPAALAGP